MRQLLDRFALYFDRVYGKRWRMHFSNLNSFGFSGIYFILHSNFLQFFLFFWNFCIYFRFSAIWLDGICLNNHTRQSVSIERAWINLHAIRIFFRHTSLIPCDTYYLQAISVKNSKFLNIVSTDLFQILYTVLTWYLCW